MRKTSIISVLIAICIHSSGFSADYTVDASNTWAVGVSNANATDNYSIDISINTNVSGIINKSVSITGTDNPTLTGTITFGGGPSFTSTINDLTITGGGIMNRVAPFGNPSNAVLAQNLILNNVNLIANTNGALSQSGSGTLEINGGRITGNSRGADGGAIGNSSTGKMIIDGTYFEANNATGANSGGAIYTYNHETEILNSDFVQNRAADAGGAISGTNLTISDTDFTENHAGFRGGAIESIGGTLNLTNVNFTDNYVEDGQSMSRYGGAIYISSGTFDITGGEFNGNHSPGGGGAINTDVSGIVKGTRFIDNFSDETHGGAIFSMYGGATLDNVYMTGNHAENGAGGALYSQGSAQVVVKNKSYFSGNHSKQGGAIYHTQGSILIDDSLFEKNWTTADGGGAVSIFNGTITNSTFNENEAQAYNGGAISGTIELLDNVVLYKNHADSGYGGGLFLNEIHPNIHTNANIIRNTTFQENTAMYGGGATFYGDYYPVKLQGNTFFDRNSASEQGGAIYTEGMLDIDTTIGDIIFRGNTAVNGGNDIYTNNTYMDEFGTIYATPVINIMGDVNKISMDGGIGGYGEINKTGANTLEFLAAADNTGFIGTYTQTNGLTVSDGNNFFMGENYIKDGSMLHFTNAAKFNHIDLQTNAILNLRGENTDRLTVADWKSDGTAQLWMNTDGATSDVLEFTNSASGETTISFNQLNGGKLTTGADILVVDTNDISNDATFKLSNANNRIDIGGAFEYGLFLEESDNNWYLQQTSELTTIAQTVGAIPALHLSIVKSGMNELRKRMGALRNNNDNDNLAGAWVRGYGKHLKIDDRADTTMNLLGIEGGIDVMANALNGKIYFGVMGGLLGSQDIDVITARGAGAYGHTQTPSVGAYLTWMHKSVSSNKWFVDLTTRHFWVHTDITRDDAANGYSVRRGFWAFSGEVGKLYWMDMEKSAISIEPKFEVRYGIGDDMNFTTDNGTDGYVDTTHALSTRLYTQINFLPNGTQSVWKSFIELGIYNEWAGDTEMEFGGEDLTASATKGMGFEATIGTNVTLDDESGTYAYGALTAEFGKVYESYQANIGIRTKF